MKYLTTLIIVFLSTVTRLFSQNCPSNSNAPITTYCEQGKGINTNPGNLVNPECSAQVNNFDWRVKHIPGGVVPDERFWVYYQDDNNPSWIRNPFNGPIDASYTPFLTANHGSNYQPEDGWELLKVDFGSNGNIGLGVNDKPGASTVSTSRPKLPYMMLYNRYTGTLRFFGSLLEPDNTYETVRIELRVPEKSPGSPPEINTYQNDLKATNLLSIQGESVQPLDQETDEAATVVFVKYTNNPQVFFWFDVPLAYDPCLCNNRAQLDVSFSFVQTANIDITGSITGSIKTKSKGSQNYGKMVFDRVLAAGKSGATAIATKGAVINVKAFIDLIDIVKDYPGRDSASKSNLNTLKSYLTCTEKFYSVVKGNYNGLDSKDSIKKIESAFKILDGAGTFFSSLASGCNNVDNGATTITETVKASGTYTLIDEIQSTRISLALPGSKWNDKDMQSSSYVENNGKVVPIYPTYNERLGTFALLETPKISLFKFIDTCSFVDSVRTGIQQFDRVDLKMQCRHTFSIKLKEDLIFTHNPKLNLNLNRTNVYVRLVIKKESSSYLTTIDKNQFCDSMSICMPMPAKSKALNIEFDENSDFTMASAFVPIDYVKDMPMRFSLLQKDVFVNLGFHSASFEKSLINSKWSHLMYIPSFEDRIFLQFKIVGESNNVGSANSPVAIYQLFTYPIKQEISINDPNANNLTGNFIQSTKFFDQDNTFANAEDLYFEGPVFISAKLATASGIKVKIYSLKGFELEPGAEISPDIELIVGPSFTKIPQPAQTAAQISSFCSNNNKYKAQVFGQAAIQQLEEEQELQRQRNADKAKELMVRIFPNPANSHITVSVMNHQTAPFSVRVSGLTGRTVIEKQFNGENMVQQIDVNSISNGIYFVTVICDGKSKTSKIIVHQQ